MSIVIRRAGWMAALWTLMALAPGLATPALADSPAGAAAESGIDGSRMPAFLRAQGVSLVDGGVTGGASPEAPLFLAQAATGSRAAGTTAKRADEWRFIFTPITFWAMEMHGDVGARGVSRHLDIDFSDIQDALDWSVGVRAEVGRGPWSVFLIASYMAFEVNNLRGPGPLGVSADFTQDWLLMEFGGMYRLATVPLGPARLLLDGMAGARYLHVETELKADNGLFDIDANMDIFDPMVGLRVMVPIVEGVMEGFGLRASGNVGGFGLSSSQSHLSWAFSGDVNYTWQVSKTWALNFAAGYSVLDINWDGGDRTKHDLDIQFRGPFLALSILF